MRVAVFSDTHGRLDRLPAAAERLGQVDAVIHLGDLIADVEAIGQALSAPVYAVRGNGDRADRAPLERVVEVEGVRLLCVHGHLYPDLYRLSLKAEQERCDAALFGHTHVPLLEAHGRILLLNPGSLSRPRGSSRPGCALLTIAKSDLRVQMLAL